MSETVKASDCDIVRAALCAAVCDEEGLDGTQAQIALDATQRLENALASALDTIEAVKAVEEWRRAVPGRDVTCYLGPWRAMEISLTDTGFTDVATADSLHALGRALAAREGATTKDTTHTER